ncbi:MAG: DsbA family protein [Pseudomonadota bacterium]|nr:DsbA family protein [Pseudomonadota bacterium]
MPLKNVATLLVTVVIFTGAVRLAAPAKVPVSEVPLTSSQKSEIEGLIGRYLRENPRVIVEAIQNLQRQEDKIRHRQATQNLARYRQQLIDNPASPFVGKRNASITVVEFFDYRCLYCKRMLPAIERLLKEDTDVRYVFKEFPILSSESRIAAAAALAAWNTDSDHYYNLHRGLMGARRKLTRDRIFEIARKAGYDIVRLQNAMQAPEVESEILANTRLAQQVGITGTPGFIIGERIVEGTINFDTLKNIIAEARAKSG